MEYIHKAKIPLQDIIFIYLEKYQFSNVQMVNTFEYYKISKYIQIKFRNSNIAYIFGKKIILGKNRILKIPFKLFALLINFFVEKKLYKMINKHHTIIFGDPNYKLYIKLSKLLFDKKIVLLDDGLGSNLLNSNYSKNNDVTSFSFIRNFKEANINNHLINDFSFLKSIVKPIDKNQILFIGQPLIEARLLSIDMLESWLKKISHPFHNQTINYYPHRWELEHNSYQLPVNFQLIEYQTLPIELSIITSNLCPNIIVSYYSAALVTLKNILPKEVVFYAIDIANTINRTEVDKAYNIIKDNGIEILHL